MGTARKAVIGIILLSGLALPAGAAPPYRIERQAGAWRLVAPDGKPFFSLGVCCVNMGTERKEYDPAKPGYAAWRQYETPVAWADATLARLKSWGFTTVGGWSDMATLRRSRQMDLEFTPVLHVGSTAGAPWFDMWDPKVIRRMEGVAREQILPVRDDPRLIGYYTDNEMGWWNAVLFKMTLEHRPESGQRRRLIRLLREEYGSDWSALCKAFVPRGAKSFAELEKRGVLTLRAGGNGMRLVRRFIGIAAARYYQLTRQIIRKYDRRALILGDRYQSFYYPEVARAARPYVDAISTNLNAHWNDGTLARFYLETLHALTGRPLLIGEFYMTARENRSGNKNDSSGFSVVPTQEERAAGFRNTLTAIRRLPYVLGADWFQYYDEPTFGRGDGENYNMGMVDIHDRPYEEITSAAASFAQSEHKARPDTASPRPTRRPDALAGVPPAPKEPMAALEQMLALKAWDRERGFVPPRSPHPVADLYLCWEPEALYLGVYAMDAIETDYYASRRVPEADRPLWTLHTPAQRAPIRARLGAGRPPLVRGDGVTVATAPGWGQDVRTIAVMKIPAALLGKETLQPGDRIPLTSALDTLARAYRVEWSGEFRLAE